eukprot:gene4658-5102_t
MASSLAPSSNPAYQTLPGQRESEHEIELPSRQEDAVVFQSVDNDIEMNGESLAVKAIPSDKDELHLLQDVWEAIYVWLISDTRSVSEASSVWLNRSHDIT